MIQPLARRNFSFNACIPLAVVALSLPLRADITLVDYTTNPAAAGSPARQSNSSGGVSLTNVFGASGAVTFFTLDLNAVTGPVVISNFSVLTASRKHIAGPGTADLTKQLFENYTYTIAVVPFTGTTADVGSTLASPAYAYDTGVHLKVTPNTTVSGAPITTTLAGQQYDVLRISPSSETFTGLAVNGGRKYSIIFLNNGYIDNGGITHNELPFILTIPEAGVADSIYGTYFNGSVTSTQSVNARFAYSVEYHPAPTPYQTWAQAEFSELSGGYQHPDAAITADPDGDTLPNGIEYTFGSDPRDPASGRGQVPLATADGCSFLLPSIVPEGIRLRVEGSDNLTGWTTHATRPPGGPWTGPVVLTPLGTQTRHTFADPAPSTHRFFRLAAEEP